jgi:hypothetical protein
MSSLPPELMMPLLAALGLASPPRVISRLRVCFRYVLFDSDGGRSVAA